MCGIAGIVGGAPLRPALEAMLTTLEHRGPDDRGVYLGDDAALGMTRLAIIDLVTGRQPMTSEDGNATIVFNGEIYNFRALRAELEARGQRFRTRSDTEVILRAWELEGEACVERLRGMFAFAVWDARRRTLFLARDRVGKKPLYYWQGGGAFVFASEIKALFRHPGPGREVDWAAFHHYLAYGYTPPGNSAFAGIAKLPPGHTATLTGGTLALRRYWALPAAPAAPVCGDVTELGERIRHEIREAVRLRLESDVPLGVFLSGGIDSSVVTASMREVTSGRIATFSIGFGAGAASYDELPFARQVAARFGTDHYEEVLEPKAAELAPVIVRAFDEPFADSSAIATFAVAAATVRHVKVALSGIGGDETFAGYPRYLGLAVSEYWARVPHGLRRAVAAVAERALPETFTSRNWRDWALRFAAGAELPLPERYFAWTRFFDAPALAALATPALSAELTGDPDAAGRQAWRGHGHGEVMDGAFRVDLASYLPDDLLVMADRMSMAHSLELRAPFCDHRVIETSLGIAPSLKTRGFRLKGLLKQAYADVLPPAVLARRKQGFMIPLARWLRGDLRPLLEDLLSPERVRARGLFRVERVEAMKAEHLAGRRSHADRLWTLMMAELWLREYLDHGGRWTLAGARERRAAAARIPAPQAPRTEDGGRRPLPARPRRLRVLAVSDVSVLALEGGAERGLWEVTRRLAARGHAVRILSRAPAGVGPRRARREEVDIVEFASSRRSLVAFLKSAVLEARRSAAPLLAETDVLHVHQPLSGYGVLTSPLGRRVPSLYTFHSPAPLEYRLRRRMTEHHIGGLAGLAGMLTLWSIERACLQRATRIQVLSDYMASLLWKLYRIPAERIVKIPGGADLARFRPAEDRRRLRAALGLPLERPTLLTVRNLETRMGLDTLLDAMVLVARRMPEAHLLLGGAGSLREPLEAQARANGLDRHVTFLGFIPEEDLPRYYQAADAFVLPTRELEGFGLVTVEALACGTPVLGTRVGATPELLEALDPALVFGGEGPAAMAADVLAFLERQRRDPAGAAALRETCARHAVTRYDWEHVAVGLEATLTDLAERGRPAAAAPEPCEACGGAMRDSALLYDGRRYRRCAACRARRVATVPSAVEVRHEYEVRYPRRFPPALIAPARREMMSSILDRLQRRQAPGRLLDVGCGGGHFMAAAVEHGWRPLGTDLSGEACAAARRLTAASVVQADAAALPFRAGTLDAVALVSMLDHTTQPLAAVREAARVLRPGGVLVVRVPNGGFHAGWAHVLGRLGPAVRWRDWDTYPVLRVFAFGPRALRRLV
ncbi:MAG TPA: asparagine synthase (glutamine-hydrolyzing), partial [Candidatus Binatia bacterium]|nr:asparagine synthase (glutamine-hydrolyzing) [Candidatus Binatia bacterium]